MTRGRRILLALLLSVGVLLLLAGGRWYLAKHRVDDVARKAQQRVANSKLTPQAAGVSVAAGSTRTLPEAAGRAAMHIHALETYRTRSAADLAALPPAQQPLTPERLEALKAMADDGNARAACLLSAEVSKCRYFPSLVRDAVRKSTEAVEASRSKGEKPVHGLVVWLNESIADEQQLATECPDSSLSAQDAPWRYLLHSALLGYEPAMEGFWSSPPFVPMTPGESLDTTVAYLEYAGPFLEALAQRGNLRAVTQASWYYRDVPSPWPVSPMGLRIVPEDPLRALMYGYVRKALVDRWEQVEAGSIASWGNRRDFIEGVESKVDANGQRWARQMADQVVAGFGPDAFKPPAATTAPSRRIPYWQSAETMCRK